MSAAPNRSRNTSSPPTLVVMSPPTLASTPSATGSIIAAAPVLDMNGEVRAPTRPKATMIRVVESPTTRMLSTVKARRRSSRWTSIASAMMKLPMKRNTVELEKLANTALGSSPTCSRTQRQTPRIPATGMGMASVIQRMITRPRIAARFC